jgi:hypothetical protein
MKTYKLIKTYPGSFPLGHLAILDESVKYYNLGTTTRSLDYIENHPENWQHVCYKCHENVYTCKSFGCKQAILITEDGVDIFENNTSIYILDKFTIRHIKHKDFNVISKYVKYFSTKEKAEEYILMNKPCLSLQNVLEITNKMISFHPDREIIKRELTKIVKQKLK